MVCALHLGGGGQGANPRAGLPSLRSDPVTAPGGMDLRMHVHAQCQDAQGGGSCQPLGLVLNLWGQTRSTVCPDAKF